MKILLIAGHGDGDPGAIGCGYKEADLTREVVTLLKVALEDYATVDIADTSKNWYKHIIKQGGDYSFIVDYDYVLEVHFNACVGDEDGDGKTTGVEIFVTTSEKGTSVEKAIVTNIAALGLKNRGVKKKNWAVINRIKKAGVSSALLETCFIDDADDMQIYTSKKQQLIQAIANGIIDSFNLTKKTPANTVVTNIERDNTPDSWAKDSVDWATKINLVRGDENGDLKLHKNCTRQEMLIFLHRLYKHIKNT